MKIPLSRTIKLKFDIFTYQSKGWKLSDQRRDLYLDAAHEWNTYYLPIPVKGLTVLDVGAGDGETARFFLEHGAEKIIGIECDDSHFKHLKENAAKFPIEPIYRKFSLEDLKLPFDFMKMDIEGYEEDLLDPSVEIVKPCIVEVHGLQLIERFKQQGWTIMKPGWQAGKGTCCVYAYKNIEREALT